MTEVELLTRRIAEVARALQAETGSVDTMDLAVSLAVEVMPGAEDAGISLVHRRGAVETPATTSDRALQVDKLQYELGRGPCLSAIRDHEIVSSQDLADDPRWGEFGPRAAKETGVRSMLAFRMFTAKDRTGALNLYSTQPNAFHGADVDAGLAFAAHAAIAITDAQQAEQMEIALDSRALIGQATGVLMAHYDLDPVRAFAVLARYSQHNNVKLHLVAAEVVRTRSLPLTPAT